jgi:TatD DNase family protein
MQLIDTHCHIHEIIAWDDADREEYSVTARWHKSGITDPDAVIATAVNGGVTRMICVGCTVEDSQLAVDFVQKRPEIWASIGIHPHEAARYAGARKKLDAFAALAARPKVVAVGECGLDYYYEHSPRAVQLKILHFQFQLAQAYGLPMIFHVRDAFEDFWPVFDQYPGISGVIHSFTATEKELHQALERGLYIGLNGIMTFTKDEKQLEAAKKVPPGRLLLETDAPFLTPKPHRGTICLPKHVRLTAEFLADLRGETLEQLAEYSSANALALFKVS